ncbi:LysR substrate-binding domain-containing protein [Neptuniibacter caesariensis]|uniref:Transcriptional Regulator, LysR family protein n=1 Tax=Neptuniibacter caesariensis TaxID=207954 RepID=A0A7U8C7Z3_NEPCE|nr:LysR substrate-binding domain-containing protein [Neptuniibacter caesariensis]EAR61884.1 Transcriptional Regulator, LysR family protein [Oceanospirillum sp. MED92] [Neptuniibacter caesariensis]
MKMLNLKHLHYFWLTAREGSITQACNILDLAPQTLSAQIATLEDNVNHLLFKREGRNLVLTPMGKQVYAYAEKIFDTTSQLEHLLDTSEKNRSFDFTIGIAPTVHRILAWKIIKPALDTNEQIHLVCKTANTQELLVQLKQKKLDAILTDYLPLECDREGLRAHKLLSTTMAFFYSRSKLEDLKEAFPACLKGGDFLSYGAQTPYLSKLKDWFKENDIEINIRAEIDDSALLKVLGQSGEGFFSAPGYITEEVCQQYDVEMIGEAEAVTDDLFLLYRESAIINPVLKNMIQEE